MDDPRQFTIYKLSKIATRPLFQPQLLFLPITILMGPKVKEIKALVDSGCAKTAMSANLFNILKALDPTILIRQSRVKIQTCDGTTHGIKGLATINFLIGRQKLIKINIDAIVVDHLADDFLIGADILNSSLIIKTTPDSIYFKCPATNKEIAEKFIITMFPLQTVQIKADNRQKLIAPIKISTLIKGFKPFENTLEIKMDDDKVFQINKSTLDRDTFTFQLKKREAWQNLDNYVFKIQIAKLSTLETTSNDEYMNDDEKRLALEYAKLDGYYQPSVTSYIENRNMITEADKIDIPGEIDDTQFIKLFDLTHFNDKDRSHLELLLVKNRQAFAMHKYDIGRTNVLEMDIEITTKDPKIQKYVPIAMNVRERANEILQQMEYFDIIRECHEPSPYVSNILVIPKKDNVSVRLLFDGRILNYDTKRMPMSLISKGEILSKLVAKTHLTSLDFADAFYQIPLTKEAQPLTAFWTPNQGKRMCFNRAPQGLRNSPMYLKMVLDKVFYDMDENVIFYADDLLVASDGTMMDHFRLLDKVLNKLVHANLKLRPQKLLIARDSIEFLGMVFKRQTLNIPEARLEAFRKLPSPNTAKRLKSALCAFSYYRHFVPHFATITRDLMQMTTLPAKDFKFLPHHEQKFRDIIKVISENAKTYFPDMDKPFYVQTDASMFCAGGRLFQKDSDDNEKLIAAVSRTFTKTEQNYTIYKKEALALLYTLRSMDYYIQFAPKLIIMVDSKALTYIRLAKESSGILLRFSLELSKYEADIIHVPGEQNEISDLLSRQHKDIARIENDNNSKKTISEKDTIKIVEALTMPNEFTLTKSQLFNLLNGPSPIDDTVKSRSIKSKAKEGIKYIKNTPVTLTSRKIKMPRTTKSTLRPGVLFPANVLTRSKSKKQNKDTIKEVVDKPDISMETHNQKTINYTDVGSQVAITHKGMISVRDLKSLQEGDELIQASVNMKQFLVKNGIAYWKIRSTENIFLPKAIIPMIVHSHHFIAPGIHKTTKQIMRDILKHYYFPRQSLQKLINKEIGECHICQLYKDKPTRHEIAGLPRHTTARISWSMDLITDLPLSQNKHKFLLVCVDDFSNYLITVPLQSTATVEFIKAIKYHIIQPFGIPKFLRSDEQPGVYNSKEFYEFATNHNIQVQATAVASPFSNGRAERLIKTFKIAARKYFYQQKTINKWDEEVIWIVAALNSSINSYGYSPEEIMFGVKSTESIELLDTKYTNDYEQADPLISELLKRAEFIRKRYFQHKNTKQKANITFKNKEADKKHFEKGELVLHRQLQVSTGTASKWEPLMTGPFVIEEVLPSQRTAICVDIRKGTKIKAHFTNLTRYRLDESTFRVAHRADGILSDRNDL